MLILFAGFTIGFGMGVIEPLSPTISQSAWDMTSLMVIIISGAYAIYKQNQAGHSGR